MFILGLFVGIIITALVAYKIHKKIIENIEPEKIFVPVVIEKK